MRGHTAAHSPGQMVESSMGLVEPWPEVGCDVKGLRMARGAGQPGGAGDGAGASCRVSRPFVPVSAAHLSFFMPFYGGGRATRRSLRFDP